MRKVDVVGTGLLVTSRFPRHGYVGRRGSRDVHQYRRRPTIVNLLVGQTECSSHGVPSESNQPCRDREVEDPSKSAKPIRADAANLISSLSSSISPSVIPSSCHPSHYPVASPSSACCSPAVPAVVILLYSCCPLRLKANLRLCSTYFSACTTCPSGVPTGLDSLRSVAAPRPALSVSLSIILPSGHFIEGHRRSST
jgi:hypothetical protein